MPSYITYMKGVGEVVVKDFPMLVCSNCDAQWISGEGDKMIEDAVARLRITEPQDEAER